MQQALNSKKYQIEEETKHSNRLISGIKELYYKVYKAFANSNFLGCFKKTIIMTLPIIVIGVIIYFIANFPIPAYQDLIEGTSFKSTLNGLYEVTLGNVTLYFTIILTYKYMKDKITNFPVMTITILSAVLCVSILSSTFGEEGTINYGFKNLFLGILYSFFTVKVFAYFTNKRKITYKVYTTESRKTIIMIANLLIPFVIVLAPTLTILAVAQVFGDTGLVDIIAKPFIYIFEHLNIEILAGIIYAIVENICLFFGIGIDISFNEANMSGVINPIFMQQFIYIPMIMGFAITLLFLGKRKTDKIYGAASIPSAGFCLARPVHYGYSLILNPLAIFPTLVIPIVTTVVSYFLFQGFGIDSVTRSDLPLIFYNGYKMTGNYFGILIQGINIAISSVTFIPFVLLNNYARERAFRENVKNLYPRYLEAKQKNKDITIFDFDYELGETAKVLCNQLIKDMELMKEVENKVVDFNDGREKYNKQKDFDVAKRELLDKLKKQLKIKSYFQPIVASHVDFNDEEKPTSFEIRGMECLMRWWFNDIYIIPPLAIEIARNARLEYDINFYLWQNMLINVDRKRCKSYITFNISMNCLERVSFVDDLMMLFDRYDMDPSGFVIEITEEDEFSNEDTALEKICDLKEKGFDFAIDDYGAGQTSMKYFQTNAFELVKIDGDLVKKAKENEQVYDIIGNIKELGKKGQKYANIQFRVLCEFIEDKDSFDRLKELKVDYYQGYLFGKAMEFDEIVNSPMMPKGSQKHV